MEELFIKEGMLGVIILAEAGVIGILARYIARLTAESKVADKDHAKVVIGLLERTLINGDQLRSSIDNLGESFQTQELLAQAVKVITDRLND